jgi:hypothetical protein
MLLAACGSDTMGFDPVLAPGAFFAGLSLSQHAVNLSLAAPSNSMRLVAAPVFGDGTTVPGTVIFESESPQVTVGADGTITAVDVTGAPVLVRASLTYQGVTRTDSAYVMVTSTAPDGALQYFSIQPVEGDSAKVATASASFDIKPLTVTTRTTTGDPVPGLVVAFRSSDTVTATVDQSGTVVGYRPGRVTLYASTYAYGVEKADSLSFIVGQPLGIYVRVAPYIPTGSTTTLLEFSPATITIGVGGNVVWLNNNAQAIDMVFDDATDVGPATFFSFFDMSGDSGNVRSFTGVVDQFGVNPGYAVRSFPKPGRYPYHSTLYDHPSGVVIVCDERTTLCPP